MKTFVTLLALVVAVIFVAPAFAGEEPFKAAVGDDRLAFAPPLNDFYLSQKLWQFTHRNTNYYGWQNGGLGCGEIFPAGDPRITNRCRPIPPLFINYFCPALCRETFRASTAVNQPEVCCTQRAVNLGQCPDPTLPPIPGTTNALVSSGNSGWYEWQIALPKKPEGELNIEIECGVLKPNSFNFLQFGAIDSCAGVTGEPVAGQCTRVAGAPLIPDALPKIEVIAQPGCQPEFSIPFHLTAYKNPGRYLAANFGVDNEDHKVLDGSTQSRIALKACMDKTIVVMWPVDGRLNAKGETERNLNAGDIIQVRMEIPKLNTVDIYCSQRSVKIGGIGEPSTLLHQRNCPCIMDADCQL